MPNRKPGKRLPPVPELLSLPDRLSRAMSARDLDQQALADASGVSQGKLSKLVNGKTLGGVSANVLIRVAKQLNVPAGWLIAGEGDAVPTRNDQETPVPGSSVVPSAGPCRPLSR